jgi:hypothetical protein
MSRQLTEDERARFDTEWALANAIRESMGIAINKIDAVSYRQALALGKKIAPSIYSSHQRILDNPPESANARLIREKAEAESRLKGINIEPYEFAMKEVERLKLQIEANPDGELMRKNLDSLLIVAQELKPRRHTETEVIFGDAFQSNKNLVASGVGKGYQDYRIDLKRMMRIRVLHPDPPESKIGADLIYELLDEKNQTARLVFMQYKMWEKNSLSFAPRVGEQLTRLEKFVCKNRLCDPDDDRRRTYRLPHCAAFLRPTDRLQFPNSKMASSGLHVPLCVVKESWEENRNKGKSLRRSRIEDRAVPHTVLGELFTKRLMGSKAISWKQLELIYKETGIFEDDDAVLLHTQETTLI